MGDISATADATGDHGGECSVASAHPVAVKGGATMSVAVLLLALLVASVAVFLMSSPPPHHDGKPPVDHRGAAAGEEDAGGKRRAGEPVEHAVGDGVGVPPGFNSRLDAFRTWARLTWMKLRQPRSDEPRRYDDAAGSASSVAGAAKKSFEMGKETVEQAAATAAKATGETVEKAKEKARRAAVAADEEEEL
ncbi:hypothetical protein PR202_gb20064 [Eleusine coracana subsp. coracana]|uniref:Uncharacterized protein n=1 Tax=Eleusine coracana subsp. coracana TaxID=191504 RepID=A0AAV5F7L9_ELECO|nr:hypothetical protein PR202_gb20064 [Eleusine coracana subsp. coracana]